MDSTSNAIISFKDVSITLGGRKILDRLSFEVQKGDIFFLIGYSGSGKSVTLQNLTGLMVPDSGSINVLGQDIVGMNRKEMAEVRRNIGFLFQSGALINWLTVAENVELPLREHTSMSRRQRREIVSEKLKLVNMENDGGKYPSEISGGMKKRASLARAIALDPDIVLFDEPTSGLDPVIARQIDELTQAINRVLGITCIVVTHDMESVFAVGTRVGFFYKGRMEFCGSPDELRDCPLDSVQYFITGGREAKPEELRRRRMSQVIRSQPQSMRKARVKAEQESARALALGTSMRSPVVTPDDTTPPNQDLADSISDDTDSQRRRRISSPRHTLRTVEKDPESAKKTIRTRVMPVSDDTQSSNGATPARLSDQEPAADSPAPASSEDATNEVTP